MPIRHLLPKLLCVLLAALASPALHAERADRDKPLNIESDTVDVDDKKKTSVFRGKVVATKGTMVLKADTVTVREDEAGNQFGTALGKPATFRQKRDNVDEYVEGEGLRLEYDSQRQIIEAHDNAEVRRTGGDVVRGNFIEYNTVSGQYRAIGSGQTKEGAAAPAPGGRVYTVIQPRNRTQDAKPAPDSKP